MLRTALGRNIVFLALGSAVAVGTWITAVHLRKPDANPSTRIDHSSQLESELRNLEHRVLSLQTELQNQRFTLSARTPAQVITSDEGALSQPPKEPDPVETLTDEERRIHEEQRMEQQAAAIEEQFADEPRGSADSAHEEASIRERLEPLEDFQVSKLECRTTMCRLEVKTEVDPAGAVSKLGFKHGGRIRRLDDGTLLVFAGVEGFSFQETHRLN